MSINLTDQQQAVVAHNEGAALVFAVAGAGKTTAMVHRIERLVRESVFPANKILATSFGKMNERDLRTALSPWPACSSVQVSTLHALSNSIVRMAMQRGLLKEPTRKLDIGRIDHTILNFAIAEATSRNATYRRELFGFDRQDFLDYVGHCKSNLAYASLDRAQLPASAASLAKQAAAPGDSLTWYLDLYKLYEDIRRKNGWIGFDDMLMTGWEVLHRDEGLLQQFQEKFACILVDEYQDINLAQSEILDMLSANHRNFMAIGDDDQTIYEWRGADPRFILEFPKRYTARTFLISDNFRSPAGPILLANRVIANNKQRQRKQLHLTKGFGGTTKLHVDQSVNLMAQSIVQRVKAGQMSGRSLNDMAVLVRLNAQTPPIEQQLIANEIPYVVSKPFYERPEIKVLIAYCRLAWCEKKLIAGEPLSGRQKESWVEDWGMVHNRPKRYINRELKQSLPKMVIERNQPLSNTLFQLANTTDKEYLAEKLDRLGDTIEWLSAELDNEAYKVLSDLDLDLGYQTFLRENTGSLQVGEGRAVSVQSFIDYAKGRGSVLEFMQHIRQLAQQKIGRNKGKGDVVTLTTIHQSKGLEWPIVFIPNCNQGILPFTDTFSAEMNWKAHIEEERRLFYVALTRSQEELHLHSLKHDARSQFVNEARVDAQLATLEKFKAAINRDIKRWEEFGKLAARDCQTIIKLSAVLGIERYLEHYWQDERRKQVLARFVRCVEAEGISAEIGISNDQLKKWLTITPVPETVDFPGVSELIGSSIKTIST